MEGSNHVGNSVRPMIVGLRHHSGEGASHAIIRAKTSRCTSSHVGGIEILPMYRLIENAHSFWDRFFNRTVEEYDEGQE